MDVPIVLHTGAFLLRVYMSSCPDFLDVVVQNTVLW